MIAATTAVRATSEWIPVSDPSRPDDGFLGQVPPPSPRPSEAPPTRVEDPATGYESPRDAREGGWLGQVPPPATTTSSDDARSGAAPPPTGHESREEAREAGWLGQTPPPSIPNRPDPVPPRSTYANPHLAPEPWKADPVLPGTDPTLFG